jgi:hypothetical protein
VVCTLSVILLSAIGLFAAIWLWQNVHPVVGVTVGILFIGGAGWKVIGALFTLAVPSGRKAYGPEGRAFIASWEQRMGQMSPGSPNLPPPGIFREWLRDNRNTGIEPGPWIDDQLGLTNEALVRRLQMQFAHLNAQLAPLLAEAQQMSAIRSQLEALGAAPDPEMNARIKREMEIPDTPFNT